MRVEQFLDIGVDGFFSDAPAVAWEAIDSYSDPHSPLNWMSISFYILTALVVIFLVCLLVTAFAVWSTKRSRYTHEVIADSE
jgi:heme/copper-type cytochrome/quinol oxidase subunit 2